jgi:hypothetical protein
MSDAAARLAMALDERPQLRRLDALHTRAHPDGGQFALFDQPVHRLSVNPERSSNVFDAVQPQLVR